MGDGGGVLWGGEGGNMEYWREGSRGWEVLCETISKKEELSYVLVHSP